MANSDNTITTTKHNKAQQSANIMHYLRDRLCRPHYLVIKRYTTAIIADSLTGDAINAHLRWQPVVVVHTKRRCQAHKLSHLVPKHVWQNVNFYIRFYYQTLNCFEYLIYIFSIYIHIYMHYVINTNIHNRAVSVVTWQYIYFRPMVNFPRFL